MVILLKIISPSEVILCLKVVPVVLVVQVFFMVSSIFNSAFLIGYPDSNEFAIVEGGTLRSVIILVSTWF